MPPNEPYSRQVFESTRRKMEQRLIHHRRARSLFDEMSRVSSADEFGVICRVYTALVADLIFEDRRCLSGLDCDPVALGQFYEWEREIADVGTDADVHDVGQPVGTYGCLVQHAEKWRNNVVTDLGALPGVNNSSGATWISANGIIVGFSENSLIDPLSGAPELRADAIRPDERDRAIRRRNQIHRSGLSQLLTGKYRGGTL